MPGFYSIDKERRLVLSTAAGVVTLAEVLEHQEKLSHDPDFDPNFSQLLDASGVTKWNIANEDVRTMAQANIFSPHARRAFLVSSDEAFGLGRMFENLRDTMGEHAIQVFRNSDEALAWLLSKNTAS